MTNGRKSAGKFIILAFIFIVFELIVCMGAFGASQSDLKYSFENEISPLVLKSVELKNCSDQRGLYDISDDEELIEVTASYQNTGSYTAIYGRWMEFSCTDDSYGGYDAYLKEDYDLRYVERYSQVIPAGKSGSFRWIIVVDDSSDGLIIEEKGTKLIGKNMKLTLDIPKEKGETVTLNLE